MMMRCQTIQFHQLVSQMVMLFHLSIDLNQRQLLQHMHYYLHPRNYKLLVIHTHLIHLHEQDYCCYLIRTLEHQMYRLNLSDWLITILYQHLLLKCQVLCLYLNRLVYSLQKQPRLMERYQVPQVCRNFHQ